VRVLGIDCGTECTGWGVIESDGRSHRVLAHGVIRTAVKRPLEQRLAVIAQGLRSVLQDHHPDAAVLRAGPAHAVLEVGEQPAPAVIEEEQQELVLRVEVLVEALQRELGLLEDRPQRRVDVAGPLDHPVGGVEHLLDLGLVLGAPLGDGPFDGSGGEGRTQTGHDALEI